MNRLKKNIVAGLVMVACTPLNVLANDYNGDTTSTRQMMQSEAMPQDLLLDEQKRPEVDEALCEKDSNHEIKENPKVMEEIEKNETERQINQDQPADLLEEMLMESTESDAAILSP